MMLNSTLFISKRLNSKWTERENVQERGVCSFYLSSGPNLARGTGNRSS